jgi:hypothetical protein
MVHLISIIRLASPRVSRVAKIVTQMIGEKISGSVEYISS